MKVTLRRRRALHQWRSLGEILVYAFPRLLIAGALAWGATAAWSWWNLSPVLRIRRVVVAPPLPRDMKVPAEVSEGERLFGFSSRRVEASFVRRYPELRDIRVRRGWDGAVTVTGRRRRPLAKCGEGGVDEAGRPFPLRPEDAQGLVDMSAGPGDADRAAAVGFLTELRRTAEPWVGEVLRVRWSPATSLVPEEEETPLSGELTLVLTKDRVILWGDMTRKASALAARAGKVGRVLTANPLPGSVESIRFVGEDRLIVSPRGEP
jgi:hypothetical protein